MKNQFVPYELALQLKYLSFDEPCLAIYEHKNKKLTPNLGLVPEWFNETNDNDKFEWKMSAPLWQQAFDFCLKELKHYFIRYWKDGSGSIVDDNTDDELSFESKEDCLRMLIETVKNGKNN